MSLLILLLSALVGYQAYEFTESVTFCGQLCHTVMEPCSPCHDFRGVTSHLGF